MGWLVTRRRGGVVAEVMSPQRELLALCALVVAGDRCDWGVVARHAHRDQSLEALLTGEVTESGARADRTSWVVRVASADDWQAAYDRVDIELRAAGAVGARLTTVVDDDFPINLRFVHNLPPFLFYRGDLDADGDARSIAVVGTRAATHRGLVRASRMAELLTEANVTVVSGLARGIDAAAHQATLDSGGRTAAVLGSGIIHISPRQNEPLAERIVRSGGLVVSQFLPTANAAQWTFRKRNEVTSGISQGTVVIEASRTSGAKMQARLAYEHGKRVFLIKSLVSAQEWAHDMVERGQATAVGSVEEVAERIVDPSRLTEINKRLHLQPAML